MSRLTLFFFFLLSLSVSVLQTPALSSSSTSSLPSIYDVLESNALPIGLFPKGITNFTINPDTGRFEFYLQQSCDAKFESNVRYDLNVSGTIRVGELGELSGITAQELFLWFPIKGIRVDIPSSGLIYFDMGVVFKQFSLSLFDTPRECTTTARGSKPNDGLVLFDEHGQVVFQNHAKRLHNNLGMAEARKATS